MKGLFQPKPPLLVLALLLSFLLVSCGVTAATEDSLLQANRLYEKEQYDEAILVYQKLVQNGIHDAIVYYNLGNACYKNADIGCAILNYRRAQRLQPRDLDIKTNLTLARAQTADLLELEPKIFPAFVYGFLSDWNNANENALFTLAAWVILCLAVSGSILARRKRAWNPIIILLTAALFLMSSASLGIHMVQIFGPPQAVIQAEIVDVRSGPGESYITEFQLHAGAEVQVIEPRSGWLRIQAPGDLQGWAPAESLETLQVFSTARRMSIMDMEED
jgi:tetratricopeptide (TPR) repeat protein